MFETDPSARNDWLSAVLRIIARRLTSVSPLYPRRMPGEINEPRQSGQRHRMITFVRRLLPLSEWGVGGHPRFSENT